MVQVKYRGLDKKLFRDSYLESEDYMLRASKLGNFEYRYRTYIIMLRKIGLAKKSMKEKRIDRQKYIFGDLPEIIGGGKITIKTL